VVNHNVDKWDAPGTK